MWEQVLIILMTAIGAIAGMWGPWLEHGARVGISVAIGVMGTAASVCAARYARRLSELQGELSERDRQVADAIAEIEGMNLYRQVRTEVMNSALNMLSPEDKVRLFRTLRASALSSEDLPERLRGLLLRTMDVYLDSATLGEPP